MPLELSPCTEADLDVATNLAWEAFRYPMMSMFYPDGYSEAARTHSTASTLKTMRKYPDTYKKMKVVDTDLPDDDPFRKIVGISTWIFYTKERTDEQIKAEEEEAREDGFAPGANEEMLKAFFGALGSNRKKFLGRRAHIYLQQLITLPQHHRRGVGAMHLRWGLAEADKLGLPAYLEASPPGKPLYERFGYEVVGWVPIDIRDWGAKEDWPNAMMFRPAKGGASQAESSN